MTAPNSQTDSDGIRSPEKQMWALPIIAVSTLLSMSVWFSASFVLPQLTARLELTHASTSIMTIAVQLGFVIGAIGASMTGLSDVVSGRTLMALGAIAAACANATILIVDTWPMAMLARLASGVFLAFVYPSALKETAARFSKGRGLALGVMIGALTIGSALPHAVNAISDVDWKIAILVASMMSLFAGILVLFLKPTHQPGRPAGSVSVIGAVKSLRNRSVVLADIGYMGHMWELYAMWASVGAFLSTVPSLADDPSQTSAYAFCVIAIGAIGCLTGGIISDKVGRATAARLCLICSGAAAVVLGAGYQYMPGPVVVVACAFWGFWVIADSAQFSAIVTEEADSRYVGSALSLQLGLGYLTTIIPIWLIPLISAAYSWNWVFVVLAIGPGIGICAMTAMVRKPQRSKTASS